MRDGVTAYLLAKINNISIIYTVKTWKRIYINHPELYPNVGKKRGRKKDSNLTTEDWKERYEILKNTGPSSRHNERKSNIYKSL